MELRRLSEAWGTVTVKSKARENKPTERGGFVGFQAFRPPVVTAAVDSRRVQSVAGSSYDERGIPR